MHNEEGTRTRGGTVMSWLWAFRSAPQGVFASCILQKGRSACNQAAAKPRNRLLLSASSTPGMMCVSRGIVCICSSRRLQCVSTCRESRDWVQGQTRGVGVNVEGNGLKDRFGRSLCSDMALVIVQWWGDTVPGHPTRIILVALGGNSSSSCWAEVIRASRRVVVILKTSITSGNLRWYSFKSGLPHKIN